MDWMQMMKSGDLTTFLAEHRFTVILLGIALLQLFYTAARHLRGRNVDFWETPQEWTAESPREEMPPEESPENKIKPDTEKPARRKKFFPMLLPWLAILVEVVLEFWEHPDALGWLLCMAVAFAVMVVLVERLVKRTRGE